MIEFLFNIDVSIFYFINHTLSNPLLDRLFPFLTDVNNWYLTYILLWLMMIFSKNRKTKFAALGLILLITVSDQFSSNFLKNTFQRIRPCNALEDVKLLVGCSGSYSFPSSHAVNNFATAIYFGIIFPKYLRILIFVATIIAITRPYVGVHYPSDIIGGAIIGSLIGYFFAKVIIILEEKRK